MRCGSTRNLLSPRWTRLILAVSLLSVPRVSMLAWFHGRTGRDDVPLAEQIGMPANLAVAAGALEQPEERAGGVGERR